MNNKSQEQINSKTILLKMVGTKCNMNCAYCYETNNNGNNKILSFETLSRLDISLFFQSLANLDYISVVFHGGEPLLAKKSDVIFTIKLVEKLFNDKCEFKFQTNSLLISDEWISVFKLINHKLSISISLDPVGRKDLRISSRENYRRKIFKNINLLVKNHIQVGVVSIAHKYNLKYFEDFIYHLTTYKVSFLTINKIRCSSIEDELFISEMEYNKMLMSISNNWIKNKLYKKIQIQPLMSLFSNKKNKLCIYLNDKNKCSNFITFYKGHVLSCEHLSSVAQDSNNNSCNECDIYTWCGGGCLVEIKDPSFCNARKLLKIYIGGIKYENN